MQRWGSVVVLLTVLVSAAAAQTPKCGQEKFPGVAWDKGDATALKLDQELLSGLQADLRTGKYGYVDSLLVIRCGAVAADNDYPHNYPKIYGELAKTKGPLTPTLHGPYNYYDPAWHPFYKDTDLHTMQSVSKTVTSVTIGVAMTRGEFPSLDTPVLDFFDAAKVKNVDERKRRMTIRHLLSMTAGLEWYEDIAYDDPKNSCVIMESLDDWIPYVIDQPMVEEPGKKFVYNSGATELLSHIFKQATGQDIQDYAARHLFAPLGIEKFYWKRTPTGLTDTEGGLYLRPQDLARIGYLFLRNGRWNGKQIVSEDWVRQSTAPSISVVETEDYGFKWWLPKYGAKHGWAAHGFGGQRMLVVPEHDLIVVVTGWNIPDNPEGTKPLGLDGMMGIGLGLVGVK